MKTYLKISVVILCTLAQMVTTQATEYHLKDVTKVNIKKESLVLIFQDKKDFLFPFERDEQGVSVEALFSGYNQFFYGQDRIVFDVDAQRRLYFLIAQLKTNESATLLKHYITPANPIVAQYVNSRIERTIVAPSSAAQHVQRLTVFQKMKSYISSVRGMYGSFVAGACGLLSKWRLL